MSFNPIVCMQTNSTCYKNTELMNPVGVLWHSTGANNPTLKRYVQPLESDVNYNALINLIGKNPNLNDYNHASYQSGLNAWIGKLTNGSVATIQSMPRNYAPWGCGSGRKGSCNNGWIQFEICEDNLNDLAYFNRVFEEGCQLTAYLCHLYKIDPRGVVTKNGIKIPTILCHADAYKLGMGSNHGDVLHWFAKYGKTMEDVRARVSEILNLTTTTTLNKPTAIIKPVEEEEEVTQEQFNNMMNTWIAEQAKKDASAWSAEAREWAERNSLVSGDTNGQKMYKKVLTREELVAVLYRALHRNILD